MDSSICQQANLTSSTVDMPLSRRSKLKPNTGQPTRSVQNTPRSPLLSDIPGLIRARCDGDELQLLPVGRSRWNRRPNGRSKFLNRAAMTTQAFDLLLNRPIDEATSDSRFDAGLGDAAATAVGGEPALDVDRDAATLQEAIASAVRQAESVPGIRVLRIEREDVIGERRVRAGLGRRSARVPGGSRLNRRLVSRSLLRWVSSIWCGLAPNPSSSGRSRWTKPARPSIMRSASGRVRPAHHFAHHWV